MTYQLVPLISEEMIASCVKRLAQEIDRDYGDRSPILVGILKGAFVFLADLIRQMETPIGSVEFIRISSYGSSTMSSGQVEIAMGLVEESIQSQDIILVEDIVDTGLSTATILEYIRQYQPASLKLCALLDKPDRRKFPVTIDYLGLTVPDRFIVGYGIDFDQQYRQLPAIYTLA
jgi:hypoxanthine phosphoribosyltransferase